MSPPTTARWDSFEAGLREMAAAQAATDARLSELFRAHAMTAQDAKAARDTVGRIAVILEEQNIIVRMGEVRGELRGEQAALRQDVVAANTQLRKDVADLDARLKLLEGARTESQGMAKLVKVAAETVRIVLAAGGGAMLLKLFGHAG